MGKSLDSIKLKLNDGNVIPAFGLGVGNIILGQTQDLDEIERAISYALKEGYRLIDTARRYGNEERVGSAIKHCGVKRDDVFVVTKLMNHGYDFCLNEFETSLKSLDMDYVDMYLIHAPLHGKIVETYDAMLKLKEKGLVRSIGVSNFNIDMLEGLRKAGRPTPCVNQVELNVFMKRKELVSYCRSHGIQLMAYAPLTKGKKLANPELVSIAEKYHKTTAQLLIRWCLQKGFIVIPKSTNKERIVENSQVFDWSISNKDMSKLDGLPEETCHREDSPLYNVHSLKWEDKR